MNLRCAIIDDEPLALGLLESYVKKTPVLTLCGTYSSAVQAMKSLPEHPADLLFLDIQMPELNGLEHPYCLYHSFQPICHRRISGQCPRLPVETD